MLTVPEVARRIGRDPETVRRWIRGGRLRARKIGMQHLVEEEDLLDVLDGQEGQLLPEGWQRLPDGRPMPDFVKYLRARRGPL